MTRLRKVSTAAKAELELRSVAAKKLRILTAGIFTLPTFNANNELQIKVCRF